MCTARIRSLLAVTAVVAILLHGLSGNGPTRMPHDELVGAAAAICLLLATVVVAAAIPRPEPSRPAVVAFAAPTEVDAPSHPPLDGRARASPPTLQRFRN